MEVIEGMKNPAALTEKQLKRSKFKKLIDQLPIHQLKALTVIIAEKDGLLLKAIECYIKAGHMNSTQAAILVKKIEQMKESEKTSLLELEEGE